MRDLLLHNPWVQFYLVDVGALAVVFIWYYTRNLPALQDRDRTGPNEAALDWASPPARRRPREPCSVSRVGRRTDTEVELTAEKTTWGARRASAAASSSEKRRDNHVVTP
jgi:hypothetical protein